MPEMPQARCKREECQYCYFGCCPGISRLYLGYWPAGDVALAEATQHTDGMRERLNVAWVAAIHYLAPLMGNFLCAFPAITVDIVTDDRLIDIVAGRFDAGIRLGEKLHRDMVAVRLSGDLNMKVVAGPDYLVVAGRPEKPQETCPSQVSDASSSRR